MRRATVMLGLFVLCAAAAGCGGGVKGEIIAPRAEVRPAVVAGGPKIDGVLDDAAWKLAPAMALGKIDNGQAGDIKTDARVAMDARNLYVAWECFEPDTSSIKAPTTERDGDLWNDDSIELFVAPRPDKGYCHFIVNSKGVILDSKAGPDGDEDKAWTSKAKVAASVVKNEKWIVEMAIPLSDLDARGAAGTWSFNVNRSRPLGSNAYIESSWSKTGASSYRDSAGWGKLMGVKIP